MSLGCTDVQWRWSLVNIYLPLDLFSHFPVDLFSSNAAFARLIPVSLAPTEHRVIATQDKMPLYTKHKCFQKYCMVIICFYNAYLESILRSRPSFLSVILFFCDLWQLWHLLAVHHSEEVRHPKVLIKSRLQRPVGRPGAEKGQTLNEPISYVDWN